MPAVPFEVLGTVLTDGSLEMDQKLNVPPGRVKVRVETVGGQDIPAEGVLEFVERARRELEAAGHKFMNDEEVTAWLEELRADDGRIEEIYRQAEQQQGRLGLQSC